MDSHHAPILVVDPDADFRALVRALLDGAGFPYLEAEDGARALGVVASSRPALALIEVCLPAISGYEVLQQLHDFHGEGLPVILLSGERTDVVDRVGGLLLGADDYIVKPCNPGELLARIRRSLRIRRDGHPRSATVRFGRLTARELEVLALLAEGLSQDEIAVRLVVSPRTVATHISNLMGKLDVHSRAQAVALAHREGIFDST